MDCEVISGLIVYCSDDTTLKTSANRNQDLKSVVGPNYDTGKKRRPTGSSCQQAMSFMDVDGGALSDCPLSESLFEYREKRYSE